jgi:pyruvate-formate lyase
MKNNHLINPNVKRLNSATRELATRYLSEEFRDTVKKSLFRIMPLDENQNPHLHYAEVIKLIGKNAPLRIVEGEKITGSATLLEAARHMTPASKYRSTSHTTIGFADVLKIGYAGLRDKITNRLQDIKKSPDQEDFLKAMLICLEGACLWQNRHIQELEFLAGKSDSGIKNNYLECAKILQRVPENPPQNFREAIQAIWSMFTFQRLCGNWSGIGRIDEMLGPYLTVDLTDGTITLDEARELLAHFWIKGCEWKGISLNGGDAQFYQNIVLGGVDIDNNEVTNEVTYLILDVVEELKISDFPIAVRINSNTPNLLLKRIADVQKIGGGIVAIYNEDLILESLIKFGYPLSEARQFSNDGCWEIIIQGKTAFGYVPFDALQIMQEVLFDNPNICNMDFEEIYHCFTAKLRSHIKQLKEGAKDRFSNNLHKHGNYTPTTLLSMFVDGCIDKAQDYNNRGAKYNVIALHAGGLPDVGNSLYAINKLVFQENKISLENLIDALSRDWQGYETFRSEIAKSLKLYGNDCDESDAMTQRVYNDYTAFVAEEKELNGLLHPAGISTFGREITFADSRKATAFGRKAGEYLASNFSPTPNSDFNGPTAVIKSCCKMDFSKLPNGCPLDLKISTETVKGDSGTNGLVTLMKSFILLGGFFLHIDVVDNKILYEAQIHPEKHQNLAVRISGWSARFVTLDKRWQKMIINRTEQHYS